ncbi:MAG: NAD(P)(+) transhydrogenase (Re/Si-specific) subunit beta, partial [Rubrobacter sp.]|nr:NAD(P)(+) transhydrogenase (Re/Si-specific) subunit beta [Rubrobacter sp.]
MQVATFLAYLAAAALFITGIRRLRTPETARSGNTLAAVGMVIALVATFLFIDIDATLDLPLIAGGILLGGVVGAISAQRVPMTGMPQLVAAFNGVGGGCIALVALSEFYQGRAETWVAALTGLLTIIIGSISFSGSIIAFCKLQEIAFTGSVVFPLQQVVNALIFLGIILLSANVLVDGALAEAIGVPVLSPLVSLYILLAASLLLGVLFVIPIGGADMPIVISLLNAFTGLAAALSGFVLENYALLIGGTIVGASGTILTRQMSGALGRPLSKIVFQGIVAQGGGDEEQEEREVNDVSADEAASYLADEAEKVVFVPGYGLAVAQAQNALYDLMQTLESEGKEVKFGIHPVAGRMPGHMNVLLTEAGVPYEKLYDLEDINPEFEETDAVIIVGANDVVNPAAKDEEQDSPISGMPILEVENAERI